MNYSFIYLFCLFDSSANKGDISCDIFSSEPQQCTLLFWIFFISFYPRRFPPGCCRAMDQRVAELCDNYGLDVLWRCSTLRRLSFN